MKDLDRIKDLVEHIESNLTEDINVLEISSSFELSPWHFQKLFKSIVGDSIGVYLKHRRLSRAAEELLNAENNILDIAVEFGYNSHESFTRAFKNFFGVTPKEFRIQRPNINLKQKPILNEDLLNFISNRIQKSPTLKRMNEKRIVGFSTEIASPFVDLVHCNSISKPWMRLLNEAGQIINQKSAQLHGITLSPSGNFTEELLTYIAGVEVNKDFKLIDGMIEIVLPEQKVAMFEIATNVKNDNLKQKVESIYGYLLLHSELERSSGNDYEFFVNIRNAIEGDFDAFYVVPAK